MDQKDKKAELLNKFIKTYQKEPKYNFNGKCGIKTDYYIYRNEVIQDIALELASNINASTNDDFAKETEMFIWDETFLNMLIKYFSSDSFLKSQSFQRSKTHLPETYTVCLFNDILKTAAALLDLPNFDTKSLNDNDLIKYAYKQSEHYDKSKDFKVSQAYFNGCDLSLIEITRQSFDLKRLQKRSTDIFQLDTTYEDTIHSSGCTMC